MSEQKIKMRLGSYIAIAVTTLIFFIAAWIIGDINFDNSSTAGIVSAIVLVVLIVQLISISIKMLVSSIKRLVSFRKENGLWKILTLCFGIGLTLFASLIIIFVIIWIIYVIKDGLTGGLFKNILENGWDRWCLSNYSALKAYVSGNNLSPIASSTPFGLFVTSFVFILFWCAAGITYEILKKFLGGNRPKKDRNTLEYEKNVD